ncbi:MAG: putative glycoside hydrolase [Thermodesulfobacteriota bacterium]
MQIGSKQYEDRAYQADMAKLDVVIIAFWRGWSSGSQTIRSVVQHIKQLNPAVLVGQYTVLNEWFDDPNNTSALEPRAKLTAQNWWLRRADGSKVQWTTQYNTWEINLTDWTTPDAAGMRYPQWRARYDFTHFFSPVPEFDIWYFDNVMIRQRIASADWNLDGKDDPGTSPAIQAAFRNGQTAGWKTAKSLAPDRILMGNPDNDLGSPEFRGRLQGAFLEGLIGQSWSIESWGGWDAMMARYRTVLKNLQPPAIVGFHVMGAVKDYRLFRYGYTSCLMEDGYFSYTDSTNVYNSVPWFDEYDVQLGAAQDAPPQTAWKNGVYRRSFANGLVLLNPTAVARTVTLERGWKRIAGVQAPGWNNGSAVTTLTLQAKDGIVLVRR